MDQVERSKLYQNLAPCQHHPDILVGWSCMSAKSGSEIIVTKKKICSIKDSYLMWLLHLNEDFDDDILQDSMELLGYE